MVCSFYEPFIILYCWTRLDAVFFTGHNASCLKCFPVNSSIFFFLAGTTQGSFLVNFNPVLCLRGLQAALPHSCCLGCHQHLSLQFCLMHMSLEHKNQRRVFFFPVNLLKMWMPEAEMVPLFQLNLILDWVDPLSECLTSVWCETLLLYTIVEDTESSV